MLHCYYLTWYIDFEALQLIKLTSRPSVKYSKRSRVKMTDKNKPDNEPEKNHSNSAIGYGVAVVLIGGALISSIVGIFFRFPLIWAFGPGFGMLIGIVIGSIMESNKITNSLI